MGFITDLPLIDGKNGLFAYINKLLKIFHLIPIFLGEGELIATWVASIFFDSSEAFQGIF